jgi:hypothetical protein
MTDLVEPKSFDLPDCLQRIYDSAEYAAAAKEAGRTADEFRRAVEVELKKFTEEARKEHLRAFEKELGDQAIAHALGKFKGDLEGELKKLVAKRRAEELAAFHETAKRVALGTAKARSAA